MKKIICFYHDVPYDGLVYLECIPKALYYRQAVQKKLKYLFCMLNVFLLTLSSRLKNASLSKRENKKQLKNAKI